MNTISCAYAYPVTLLAEDSGGYVVTFSDFPEAITQGENADDALEEAEDCLEEAVANRIVMNLALPSPSAPSSGQKVVFLPAPTAVKAAFYSVIRELNVSNVQLAATLGIDEKEVRRLLDPFHPSKLNRIDELLRRLGRRLVVGFQGASDAMRDSGAIPDGPQHPRRARGSGLQWNETKPNAKGLYVVSCQAEERPPAAKTETQVAS
jgi:antitoxin HicB